MTYQLNGIRLKLQRAWEQIEGLNADIAQFMGRDICVPDVEFNVKTKILTARLRIKEFPEPMWGIRIGEIIHNLRSCLDHLVNELVVFNTRTDPPTPSKNQFPIFLYRAGFEERGRNAFLKRVGGRAIDLIISQQPFPKIDGGTGEGTESPLWHLKELSDCDKHRTLHVVHSMVEAFTFNFPPLLMDAYVLKEAPRKAGPVSQDVVLGRVHFPTVDRYPFEQKDINTSLQLNVAFDESTPAVGGWNVGPTLADIANRTERIVAQIFEEIFRADLR